MPIIIGESASARSRGFKPSDTRIQGETVIERRHGEVYAPQSLGPTRHCRRAYRASVFGSQSGDAEAESDRN